MGHDARQSSAPIVTSATFVLVRGLERGDVGATQLAIGQPGVGTGSPFPDTTGDVQCEWRAISSATFCHSLGLQPCAAPTRLVSRRRCTKAGSRSRPRLSTKAR